MSNKIQKIFTQYYGKLKQSYQLPHEMAEAAKNIIKCRTPAMDVHFDMCPEHHGFYVLYDSCKHRGCPQCQDMENRKWLHKKKQMLLPGSYMHYVFKLPVNLSPVWLYNKAQVADCLFKAVAKGFKKVKKKDRIERGIMLVFHSNGRGLSYHPHIHCLTTFGGFTADGRWVEKRIAYDCLEKTYKEELKNQLLILAASEKFRNPPGMDCKKEIVNGESENWKIFDSEAYKTGEGVAAYLSRHIKSGVVSSSEIVSYNEQEVVIRDGKGKNREYTRLKTEEFMMRYLNHIPPKGYRVIRNMGLFSTVKVQKTMEYKKELGLEVEERELEIPRRTCPDCGRTVVAVTEENKKKFEKSCMRYMEKRKSIPVMVNS